MIIINRHYNSRLAKWNRTLIRIQPYNVHSIILMRSIRLVHNKHFDRLCSRLHLFLNVFPNGEVSNGALLRKLIQSRCVNHKSFRNRIPQEACIHRMSLAVVRLIHTSVNAP
mmetsp:Transcript_19350/g.39184  ORF Transcript_19350/g.39184 Transcript_19350/m.39184 type:complete len:112 (-) Transcript_19350:982-1317(-)